jgi:hypothetical protein
MRAFADGGAFLSTRSLAGHRPQSHVTAQSLVQLIRKSRSMSTDESLRSLHKALLNFNKRAERANAEILVSNFVDSEPLFDLLSTPNNQVVYGRRGTGKTHALKYLAEYVQRAGDSAIYLDLRSIGSNTSIYSDGNRSLTDRASTLIVDVLNSLYELLQFGLVGQSNANHKQKRLYLKMLGFLLRELSGQPLQPRQQFHLKAHRPIMGQYALSVLVMSESTSISATSAPQ